MTQTPPASPLTADRPGVAASLRCEDEHRRAFCHVAVASPRLGEATGDIRGRGRPGGHCRRGGCSRDRLVASAEAHQTDPGALRRLSAAADGHVPREEPPNVGVPMRLSAALGDVDSLAETALVAVCGQLRSQPRVHPLARGGVSAAGVATTAVGCQLGGKDARDADRLRAQGWVSAVVGGRSGLRGPSMGGQPVLEHERQQPGLREGADRDPIQASPVCLRHGAVQQPEQYVGLVGDLSEQHTSLGVIGVLLISAAIWWSRAGTEVPARLTDVVGLTCGRGPAGPSRRRPGQARPAQRRDVGQRLRGRARRSGSGRRGPRPRGSERPRLARRPVDVHPSGDVHARLSDPDQAEKAYRHAVAMARATGDHADVKGAYERLAGFLSSPAGRPTSMPPGAGSPAGDARARPAALQAADPTAPSRRTHRQPPVSSSRPCCGRARKPAGTTPARAAADTDSSAAAVGEQPTRRWGGSARQLWPGHPEMAARSWAGSGR